jgi:hypothetical protein
MIEDRNQQKSRVGMIRTLAVIAMVLTLYGVGGDFLRGINVFFMSTPCQRPNAIAEMAGLAIPFVLPISLGLQFYALVRPKLSILLLAACVPATLWIIHAVSNVWDARLQTECKVRPLAEAMKVCKANPAYYRAGKTANGYPSLTLIAPGTTDEANKCLSWWASKRRSPEILIDQSVYDDYNRNHKAQGGK